MGIEVDVGRTSIRTVLRPPLPVDLSLTPSPLRRGPGDPCMLREGTGTWWRATGTVDGPATIRIESRPSDGEIEVEAWGPGRRRALERAPDLLGLGDSLEGFEPPPGPVRVLNLRMAGLQFTLSS